MNGSKGEILFYTHRDGAVTVNNWAARNLVAVSERQSEGSSDSTGLSTHRLASWMVLAVPLAVVLVGAWSYRWVQEDAFINFRIIGNLLAGNGPVFNVGERVEVYSDPLWMFLIAAAREVLPFVSIEWLSVWFGLGFTAAGVLLGGRAIQRLGESRGDGLILPVGLLIFSVVAGVWEFSTSGLEMGMVFCWIGLSFWLLVRTEHLRNSALWCAFVVGLGTLVRPELALMSCVFMVALLLVVAAPGWNGPSSTVRRYVLPILVALAIPVLYELWRMAYFAMIVANTALAKSAGASWWSQGFYYAWNFIGPYALWIPFGLALPVVVPRIRRWWTAGDRIGTVVLLTPVVAGLGDAIFVVHVGGDYMAARLILPAFLSLCLSIYATVAQLRSLVAVAIAGICIWALVCAGSLRWEAISVAGVIWSTSHHIQDERDFSIAATHNVHPISSGDWRVASDSQYRDMVVSAGNRGVQVMVMQPYRYHPNDFRPARSSLPFYLAIALTNIGVRGYASGPKVYIFDFLSLANPIGSHTDIVVRGRPGGDKVIGPEWMIGRFGIPGEQIPAGTATAQSVEAARKALSCAPLSSYLHAITAPISGGQAISNFVHAFTYTTMHFSANPVAAEHQLCQ